MHDDKSRLELFKQEQDWSANTSFAGSDKATLLKDASKANFDRTFNQHWIEAKSYILLVIVGFQRTTERQNQSIEMVFHVAAIKKQSTSSNLS